MLLNHISLALAAFLLAMMTSIAHPARAEVTGTVDVVDADTLEMLGQTIKLHGIDAIERDQMCLSGTGRPWPCGSDAAASLRSYIGSAPLRCEPISNFAGAILAVCKLSGRDVAGWVVQNGWALADRGTSFEYVPQEEQAKSIQAGIWGSEFVTPSDFRDGKRLELPEFDQSKPTEEPAQSDPEPTNLPAYGPLNLGP